MEQLHHARADFDSESDVERAEGNDTRFAWLKNMPCFALSAMLHLILLLVMVSIVYEQTREASYETICTLVPVIPSLDPGPKPPSYDPLPPRGLEKKYAVTTKSIPDDLPQVRLPDVEERPMETEEPPRGDGWDRLTAHHGNFSAVSANPAGQSRNIGAGAGVAGAIGDRSLSCHLKAGIGASIESESAVRAALEWLRRHQAADGSWKGAKFTDQCKKKCANQGGEGNGVGFDNLDVGLTGLAMLAFTGFGNTHKDGAYEEYVACLRSAVEYLKNSQTHSNEPESDGRFGPGNHEHWVYNHAIATLAMTELYVMSGHDLSLRKPVTDAVKLCLRAQNDGRGWRYGVKPGENDTSVTGWMVLALKTAKYAELGIPEEEFQRAFSGALSWINSATSSNGITGYLAPGDEGSRLAGVFGDQYPYSKDLSCMTAVGVLCRLFSSEKASSPAVVKGVDALMKHLPRWQERKGRRLSTVNIYYWYYGSYALFQYGGKQWTAWNKSMVDALVPAQRQGLICEDGSWDPVDEWGAAGGRVYSTALGAMTLEVYYRYTRMTTGVRL